MILIILYYRRTPLITLGISYNYVQHTDIFLEFVFYVNQDKK